VKLGVTGHQDIPAVVADYVRDRIGARLASLPPVVGVTSLAGGADQIFASLVKTHGGKLHVVLPSRHYEESFKNTADLERFRALLAQAAEVESLDFDAPSEEAYKAAGKRVVKLADRMIAVWDGKEARGHGGTEEIVKYARQLKVPTEVIWPGVVAR
jgi:hypothetical protein